MPTDTAENTPDELGGSLLEQIFELWLRPELERRGLDIRPEDVGRALVIFKPGEEPEVLIDTEAPMIVRGKATRPIAKTLVKLSRGMASASSTSAV